jgi:hypothetical protein
VVFFRPYFTTKEYYIMVKEPKISFSLDDLDATKASAQAFEFEYITSSGDNSGVFLSVLGGQSEIVTTEVARLINDRRRKQAAREVQQKIGVGSKAVEFETVESDIEFGQRLAAVRLVGWRGITEPWSVENALKLCRSNREIASQVTQQSDATANFISL